MTPEQTKQLEDMRKAIREKQESRRDKERVLELMQSLVAQKKQLEETKVRTD